MKQNIRILDGKENFLKENILWYNWNYLLGIK